MEFKNYLEKSAKEIDQEVKKILDKQLKEAERTDKKLVPLLKAFSKTCYGGKRIRGVLIKLGYEIAVHLRGVKAHLGGEVLRVAAAYEIVHSAILAHDDIVDKSATRRDKPSLYYALGGDHYGISQAITLADYGFFLAFNIMANTPVAGLFSQIMIKTFFGQMLELKKANTMLVMKLKTACYTIAGPLQIGATLGGLGPASPRLRGIKEFGENLGIAYQIQDDILDGDVKSEKEAKKQVIEYTNKAMKVLPEITNDKKLIKILHQMAEYLVRRTK